MKTTENPPTRPQRQIVRTNRETTGGLLMSVIRTLSSSRDLADRDRERSELLNGFNECDHKLNELIAIHNNDLYQVMNIFSKVLNNLSKYKERLLSIREKLMNCQKLLHCKRNELNQLWLEAVENRAQLNILEKVEYVISLPKAIDDAISEKHYVHASQSCIEGLTMLTDPKDAPLNSNSSTGVVSADTQVPGILSKIEALCEIRTELSKKKEALFQNAIDDFHKHLYQISTAEVRKDFLRLTQGTDDNAQIVLSVEIGSIGTNGYVQNNSESGSGQLHSATFTIGQDIDDTEVSDSKTGSEVLVELIKCLVILNKVHDSMEQVRERCERELITIAIRSAQDIQNTFSAGFTSTINARNDLLGGSKWNILDGNAGFNGSLLNDPSLTSDFSQDYGFLGSSMIGKLNSDMAVLSFSPLLGLCYDAYSHLPSMPTSNTNRSNERDPARRSAIKLKNFFTLLMTEFQRILTLYKETALPTFKRLETSLYSQMEPDAFYTVDEFSAKVQKLIVDLVSCVCADSGKGGFPLLTNSLGLQRSDGTAGPGTGSSANGPGSGTTALNGDLSSYFAKRRPLAGAMNAMNAVTKNTMTAVASAANAAANQSNTTGTGATAGNANQTNTNQLNAPSGMVTSSSTHNFLSSVVGGNQRQNVAPIFKFSQSSQAISWNAFLAEQAREKEKEQQDNESDDKDKDQELEHANNERNQIKDEQGRIVPSSGGSGGSSVSPAMINKMFDVLKEIASPSLDNLVIVFGILFRHSDQIGGDKNHLHENIGEVAAKFSQQIRDQVTRVVDLSYKRLQDKSTLRLFPQRSAYFENKLMEETERSKLSKDESFQLMQQQQQLNSRLYPPLFTSVVIVDITARELEALMKAIPEYREDYLGCMCHLFTELKEQRNEFYRKVTTSHHSDGSISSDVLSTNWCNDLDIMRTFKKLPNWESMIEKQTRCYEFPLELGDKRLSDEKENSVSGPKLTGAEARRQYNLQAQLSSFDDSPEDIRLRNKRETEILTQNMLDKNREKIRLSQIFGHEEGQFEQLAQLQESADWLAARCEDVVERIYESSKDTDMPDDVNIATLNQLVTDFREFAENCLILIHLEVRFHCFYYLQDLDQNFFINQAPILKSDGNDGKGNSIRSSRRYDAMHEDRVINPLLDNLKQIHKELEKASLKPHKMHYIFEGLDSLIKTIFMNAVSNVSRIKPVGVKRSLRAIFNIQKRLMSITKNAESRLDYCRKYFELLLTTPSEILAQIIEKGQEFEYSEYRTAIILLHNSKRAEIRSMTNEQQASMPIAPGLWEAELNKSLAQLDELLSKVSLNL